MNLNGKVIIVTGSSRGIGRATAVEFAREKAKIVINYNSNRKAAIETLSMVEKAGGEGIIIQGDVSVFSDSKKIVEHTLEKYGTVDILVNNAGVFIARELINFSNEDWDRLFKVNVYGVFYMIKNVLPILIEKREGLIINISSIASSVRCSKCLPSPGRVAYVATKSAINGITKSLAAELSPYNIRVNAIAPGLTETDLVKNIPNLDERIKEVPLNRIGKPEEMARTILFIAKNDFITGEIIVVSGGE